MKKTIQIFTIFLLFASYIACQESPTTSDKNKTKSQLDSLPITQNFNPFIAPDTATIPNDPRGNAIRYGRKLFTQTAYYLGPNGKVGKFAGNYMNCQNCHLEAATRPYGNNFLTLYLRYPQYRGREGEVLTIADRVNNCLERPMIGKPIPYNSREMRAFLAYFRWLAEGRTVSFDEDPHRLPQLEFPDYAADTIRGAAVYKTHCERCHHVHGQGEMDSLGIAYKYPPLWGDKSYAAGSSMDRVGKAAQFIKTNMPFGVAWDKPVLTDSEALDVAAYINSKPRPKPDLTKDYPHPEDKQFDYGHPPFADTFSIAQHKYGPFAPIIAYQKAKKAAAKK